jgi:hypothetical protein
VLGVPHLSSP